MSEPPPYGPYGEGSGNGPGARETVGGLARVAAGMWLRSAAWGVGASWRLARAASDPRAAGELVHELSDGLRNRAREALGVSELDRRLRQLMPAAGAAPDGDGENGATPEIDALRAQGAELQRQSANLRVDEDGHPAYARILEELAPDEARILRLLFTEGSQPAVDVRTTQLIGLGSELVAEGVNMVAPQAGCRHPERVAAYMNNLHRLGLVWFSKEPIDDAIAYQVLEAQPEVMDAIREASRARTVQRSIRLTPFGRDFCSVCLPVDVAELEPLGEVE